MPRSRFKALRREAEAHVVGRGKRYDVAFTQQARRLAEERRRAGRSWAAIALELGVRGETLRRWCVGNAREGRPMRPVEIVTEASGTTVSVVTQSGLRVDGLSMPDVITLLRALG